MSDNDASRPSWLHHRRVAVLLMLVVALLWGSAFPAIKRSYVLLGVAPGEIRAPLVFAGLRFLTAGLVLLLGAALIGIRLRIGRGRLGPLLLLGLLQTFLQYSCFYVGMAHTGGVKAAVIVAAGSLLLALITPLVYRDDRLTRGKLLGLGVGFGGVVLAALARAHGTVVGTAWLGDLLILGTAVSSALATLVSKHLVQRIHPAALNGYQLVAGSLLLLAVSLPFGPLELPAVGAELGLLFAYLVAVTAVAFSVYYVVVKHHALTRVAAYRFLIPLAGVVESALLIPGERLGWNLALAAGLVAAGIYLVNRPGRS